MSAFNSVCSSVGGRLLIHLTSHFQQKHATSVDQQSSYFDKLSYLFAENTKDKLLITYYRDIDLWWYSYRVFCRLNIFARRSSSIGRWDFRSCCSWSSRSFPHFLKATVLILEGALAVVWRWKMLDEIPTFWYDISSESLRKYTNVMKAGKPVFSCSSQQQTLGPNVSRCCKIAHGGLPGVRLDRHTSPH